jgi:hypothetical protein
MRCALLGGAEADILFLARCQPANSIILRPSPKKVNGSIKVFADDVSAAAFMLTSFSFCCGYTGNLVQ